MKPPAPDQLFAPDYVTYRRLWLDTLLEAHAAEMRGVVVDIGGKRENKRGSFRPPEEQARSWWYLNLDLATRPNIFADVSAVPLPTASIDTVICTEVLEHLANPAACAAEIQRILRPGGLAFVSVPFMYPIHADPYDFQRFTEDGLRQLFRGFSTLEIIPMGGYLGVLGMFIELGVAGIQGQQFHKKAFRRLMTSLARWLCIRDIKTRQPETWRKFTTGYFLGATK